MIATGRLVMAGVILAVLGLGAAFAGQGYMLWSAAVLALLGLSAFEAVRLWRRPLPTLKRQIDASLALGVRTDVELALRFGDAQRTWVELFDGIPAALGALDPRIAATVEGGHQLRATYQIRPIRRGRYDFEAAYVRVYSPLGLVARQVRVGPTETVRVVPNFRAVTRYGLMALADKMGQIGVRQMRRRGEGLEFDCLREYRRGDQLRQIDWKATARHRRLIARQYEDERNQQVLLVFDCGRRMRARDGTLSHFDHGLNAGLLLSYVALKQGDAVSVATFGGVDRWVPKQRGPRAVQTVVDQTFDLEPTLEPSDFTDLARRLAHRQKRRALVVILTNVYDADPEELEQALAVLGQRHLVLVASLREEGVESLADQPVGEFDDAITVGATHHFLEHRRQVHQRLARAGGLLLDVTPSQLSVQLVNRYLEIKRAGRL